jgi:outer membrane protein insertion porin family
LSEDVVISLRGRVGYGDAYGGTSRLPFFENFFGGGPGSIRGFEARSIGPRDSEGDPIGGNAMYAGNVELLFPPPFSKRSETVRLAAFVDFGSVVDTASDLFETNELRYSTGVGFSWLSPLGALTFSYAVPFRADGQDEEEQFQFSLGRTF